MTTIMSRLLVAAAAGLFLPPAVALADHGGPLREAPMSPLTIGLISAGAALAAGILIVIIVMALTRKPEK
jgi:hypothetical protein